MQVGVLLKEEQRFLTGWKSSRAGSSLHLPFRERERGAFDDEKLAS